MNAAVSLNVSREADAHASIVTGGGPSRHCLRTGFRRVVCVDPGTFIYLAPTVKYSDLRLNSSPA